MASSILVALAVAGCRERGSDRTEKPSAFRGIAVTPEPSAEVAPLAGIDRGKRLAGDVAIGDADYMGVDIPSYRRPPPTGGGEALLHERSGDATALAGAWPSRSRSARAESSRRAQTERWGSLAIASPLPLKGGSRLRTLAAHETARSFFRWSSRSLRSISNRRKEAHSDRVRRETARDAPQERRLGLASIEVIGCPDAKGRSSGIALAYRSR
jgi:hypothetical protein